MIGLIISIILFSFVVWGIPFFFLQKSRHTSQSTQCFCSTHLVIAVKNAEDSIEGIVRSLAWQISNKSDLSTEVYIIDLTSTDRTFFIVEKLAKEYTFIHPMSKVDYIAFLNNFE